ncbi:MULTISPECIES: TonB-dependent receptor [unclassified Novosphingobium]|uniref:TonB-dependent receptor plug domain-containing protein n=1 Tax=unclassified Novosphingobium TaxID=2644732 RepID=UPI001803D908|nr:MULTISPECIES: TonB-dependent receptor [unclassified Novosphingobium]NKJ45107.1 iron complex outermembrane receptor protein [Novosphingobium sp. SG720]NMN06810.1 iron complex outermembrane receptor protein [Novosphingobium sp. SG919]
MHVKFDQKRRGLAAVLLLAASMPTPAFAQTSADAEGKGEESEGKDIVVQATRSGHGLRDQPIRVEVIDREEVEEKQLMTPGNIAMLVSETPGLHVQVTSPALGASNVRVQGLKGRYTQILADGLPLYGGQAPAIGLLQIPPTDLGQVEIIKGAASALYGPSALGGVINLVSRRPGPEQQGEAVINATSRGGQDFTAYQSGPLAGAFSYSLTGGYSRQDRQDVDGDGWADIAGYHRWSLRPRLFWNGADGAKLFITAGTMTEQRDGGTMPGRTTPDGAPYAQTLHSQRYDAGLNAQIPVESVGTLYLRASGVTQAHRHVFGTVTEDDRHQTFLTEVSLGGSAGGTSWLGGAAYQSDSYRSRTFPGFDYTYSVPALFGQVEQKLLPDLTLAGSARWDDHNVYGSRVSPRLSMLFKPGPWTLRASLGQGFYAPTPFVEQTEANGLSRLAPLQGLRAETADTASIDLGYAQGPFEANLTLFGSNIDHAVQVKDIAVDRVALVNADGLTRTRGAELLLRYRWQAITVTGSYVHTDASEPDPDGPGRRTVPLTPRDTAGLTAAWEKSGRGKIGLEAYYTGLQSLDENPYRTRSSPYVELGAMGELILGRFSLFLNAENLLNVRQSHYNPILLPQRAPDGAWTVDAWAPLEGRTINGGVRFHWGAK